MQYIRRYGLYASRTRGIWISMPEVIARAPEGGRMSILMMLIPKLKVNQKIMIWRYLKRRYALHAAGDRRAAR